MTKEEIKKILDSFEYDLVFQHEDKEYDNLFKKYTDALYQLHLEGVRKIIGKDEEVPEHAECETEWDMGSWYCEDHKKIIGTNERGQWELYRNGLRRQQRQSLEEKK